MKLVLSTTSATSDNSDNNNLIKQRTEQQKLGGAGHRNEEALNPYENVVLSTWTALKCRTASLLVMVRLGKAR